MSKLSSPSPIPPSISAACSPGGRCNVSSESAVQAGGELANEPSNTDPASSKDDPASLNDRVTLSSKGKNATTGSMELTPEEQQRLRELQSRDREVRAHEQAHIAAGGRYVRGGASFEYETGPDGKKYAIGGEVSIDTTEEKDPRATIRKMETVLKAALAPARPSAQDRSVASQAQAKIAEASAELAKMKRDEGASESGPQKGEAVEPQAKYGSGQTVYFSRTAPVDLYV